MRKDEQDAMDLARIQILPQERQKKLQEWAKEQAVGLKNFKGVV
jgi:hypothetical protein